tara:strand:+ start:83 stop:343 length:261 start_codon:yes stop_codon:yes gene_type:complete
MKYPINMTLFFNIFFYIACLITIYFIYQIFVHDKFIEPYLTYNLELEHSVDDVSGAINGVVTDASNNFDSIITDLSNLDISINDSF